MLPVFGLLGHALNLARASQIGLEIYASEVPILEGAFELASKNFFSSGSIANFEYMKPHVRFAVAVNKTWQMLLCDAQTSGGLLIAISKDNVAKFIKTLEKEGVREAKIIGQVIKGKGIQVKPKVG